MGLRFDPILEARRQWVERGWGDAAPGMAAVTSIVRAQQLLLARIDAALRPHGVTFARYEVLALLSFTRTGRLPMGKLGERLQVHPASVTNAVTRLEADGLVARVPHPDDSRSTMATLTPAGRRRAAKATVALNEVFEDLGLDAGDLDALTCLLEGLRRHAGDAPATD